jgi:hypothetical protein
VTPRRDVRQVLLRGRMGVRRREDGLVDQTEQPRTVRADAGPHREGCGIAGAQPGPGGGSSRRRAAIGLYRPRPGCRLPAGGSRPPRVMPSALTALLLLTLGALGAPAEKTDKVFLDNGDVVTCEVKGLDRGLLKVKTDPMSTIQIKWDHVVGVQSRQRFAIELDDGTRLFGILVEASGPGRLQVLAPFPMGTYEFDLERAVFIDELEAKVLDRLKGSLGLGFTFTKASEVGQLSLTFDLRSTTEEYEWSVDASTINTAQPGRETTNRSDLNVGYRRFLGHRWFALGGTSLQHNDELDLDLRARIDLGAGRYLVQSSEMLLSATTGASVNRELYSGDEDSYNVEAFAGFDYAWFLLDSPKLDLDTSVTLYPSLTNSGRVRLDADFRVRKEFAKDLFLSVKVYGDYDSEPPKSSSSVGDYGVVLSLDYSW